MMKIFTIAVAAAASLILVAPAQSQDATRSISKLAGDVYRFQNNFHHALVTVTDADVVVDPINNAQPPPLKWSDSKYGY